MRAWLSTAFAALVLSMTGAGAAPSLLEPAQPPIRVLVVSYDPILRNHGNVRLSRYMKWHDPRDLTRKVVNDLRQASGGFVRYQVTRFIELDAFPVKRDGFAYDEASFLTMWADRSKAHQPDSASYSTIFRTLDVERQVRLGKIDEVWLWGAPYFGWDEYAMKIPGDRLFYPTDNPWFYRPYDIPDCGHTVWVMGWSYERGEAEAVHSYGHRMEGILALTVGRGVWDFRKTPSNVWNRFTKQAKEFPDDAQVGNVHGGPNAEKGYDYANRKAVWSQADDWLSYPNLTGKKRLVDCETWGGPDYQLNYLRWWMRRIPHAHGVTDGFYNNWWQYVANYDGAVKRLPPPGGKLAPATACMR